MALVLRNILKLNKRSVFCQVMSKNFASKSEGKDGDKVEVEEKIPENIIVEKNDAVTLIGINRPEKRNCVDSLTANQLISGEFNSFLYFYKSFQNNIKKLLKNLLETYF